MLLLCCIVIVLYCVVIVLYCVVIVFLYLTLNFVISSQIISTFKSACKTLPVTYLGAFTTARRALF